MLGAQTYIQAEHGEGDTITIKKQIAYLAGGTEYYTTLAKWDEETSTVIEQPDATIKLVYKDGVEKQAYPLSPFLKATGRQSEENNPGQIRLLRSLFVPLQPAYRYIGSKHE